MLDLVRNPVDRFSHVAAHTIHAITPGTLCYHRFIIEGGCIKEGIPEF